MPECYPLGPRSCRPFLVTPYTPGRDGLLSPAIPSRCPKGLESAQPCCSITIDHLRHRKTGPKHPLSVARCCAHDLGFTLYPIGFAPYRRQPILKIAPDGSKISTEEVGLREDYDDTVFAAAVDGAEGLSWARDSYGGMPDRFWGTQGRHLKLATRLVGVARDLSSRVRESIATVLSVSGLKQREHSTAIGYRAIGKAVCDMLRQLRGSHASRASALLTCGYVVGHWGEPLHWDVARHDLLRSPFCGQGTASAP
jgi:hypothetical protein